MSRHEYPTFEDLFKISYRSPSFPGSLVGEPDFSGTLCESISGREEPQSPPKPPLSELPKKPLFSESH